MTLSAALPYPKRISKSNRANRYDDADAPKGAPAPPAPAANDAIVESKTAQSSDQQGASTGQQVTAAGADEEEEDDDDDDDIDFNLGGANGGDNAPPAQAMSQDDRQSTPPYGSVHKATAKEEG